MEKNEQLKIDQRDFEKLALQVRKQYGLVARKRQSGRSSQGFMVGRANAFRSSSTSLLKPSYEQIHSTAISMGFGYAEAITLAALLFSIWSHFNTKVSSQSSKCQKLSKGKSVAMISFTKKR